MSMLKRIRLMAVMALVGPLGLVVSCKPEPPLYLYEEVEVGMELPIIDLNLELFWDYMTDYGARYDWRAEWYYGWDDEDRRVFGELGYQEPTAFFLRRYFTGSMPLAPHNAPTPPYRVEGNTYRGTYKWGYWDILVWNDVQTIDGVQSLVIDEEPSYERVEAYTTESMVASRYQAPRYTRAFYAPEPLFAAYEQAIELNPDLRGFVYNKDLKVYVRRLSMQLLPVTYIYLVQVILHNNRGRVTGVEGSANLSAMARSVLLNTGVAGEDAVTVNYSMLMKKDCKMKDETVDIIGGRLMTFGLCNHNGSAMRSEDEVHDKNQHYIDVTMQFYNATDSTLVFNVTDQVRKRYKGGVITIELDMDTVPIPTRKGGSGFNAVVLDPEEVTHVIEM